MAPQPIELEVVTPEKLVLRQTVQAVVLPGTEGSFGVLAGHLAMVTSLKPGMLKVQDENGDTIYAIGGGYAEIANNKVVVLADTAELAEDIDIEVAQKERARAVAQLKSGIHGAELDQVEISLKKALARLSVADVVRRRQMIKKK